jgi:hypothetical protein
MKKQMFAAVAVLLFTTFAPQSHAQYATRANVPFAFQAGDKMLAAGEYQVQRAPVGAGTEQLIRRTDSSASTFVFTNVLDPADQNAEAKLIFRCYGKECFLSEIWSGSGKGLKLMESRREKELTKASPENELVLVSVPMAGKS